jgi:signal transduction histidine kinase
VPYLPLQELVWSISEAHDGSLWLSTFGQLLHWKDNHVTAFGEQSDMYLYSYEDLEGTVWAGSTYAGLVCLRKNTFFHFRSLGAPFNDRIYRILEDHSGHLWITTPKGLYRVRKSDLISYLEGKVRSVFAAEFGMADGLPSTGCNGGEQNAGWTDRNGRFWVPTGGGLAMVDPLRINIETKPPRTIIEEVTLDDKPIQLGIPPQFPPNHKRLEIRFTGIDLRAPYGVRYRYQLEGFDTDWVNAGTTKVVSFTTLHPGTYHFRVISRNRDGFWDLTGASFTFQVEPQFYRTVWFYCLSSAFVIVIAGTLHLWRVRQIREKTGIALAERTRMARQLHDTLLQGVSGASLVLQAIAPAITNDDVRRRLDNALNEMQQCMTATRRALWDIHDPQPEPGDFIALLERYGRGLTMGTETRFVVEAPEMLLNYPSAVQHHLLRIGQEAILNALKHSGASEIRVSLSVDDNLLHMKVTDNGRGFNVNALEQSDGHWGLVGMREHALAIGQELAVSATPGMGTEIAVTAELIKGNTLAVRGV